MDDGTSCIGNFFRRPTVSVGQIEVAHYMESAIPITSYGVQNDCGTVIFFSVAGASLNPDRNCDPQGHG